MIWAVLKFALPVAVISFVVILFEVSVSIVAVVALSTVATISSNTPFTAVISDVIISWIYPVSDISMFRNDPVLLTLIPENDHIP